MRPRYKHWRPYRKPCLSEERLAGQSSPPAAGACRHSKTHYAEAHGVPKSASCTSAFPMRLLPDLPPELTTFRNHGRHKRSKGPLFVTRPQTTRGPGAYAASLQNHAHASSSSAGARMVGPQSCQARGTVAGCPHPGWRPGGTCPAREMERHRREAVRRVHSACCGRGWVCVMLVVIDDAHIQTGQEPCKTSTGRGGNVCSVLMSFTGEILCACFMP